MSKIVVKDGDKGLAIFTGIFFLVCTVIKIFACIAPDIILATGISPIARISLFVFAEIFVYFSLMLQGFSCKRSGALLIPISVMFMQFIFTLLSCVVSLFVGNSTNVISTVLMIVFSLSMILALILICLEINVNVSTQRRVLLKVFAILATVIMVFGYFCFLLGDIFRIFTGTLFADSLQDWRLIVQNIVFPVIESVKVLIMCFALFLMSCWMATRHKYIELKEHKVTDEELYDMTTKEIKKVAPVVVKSGDGVESDENIG